MASASDLTTVAFIFEKLYADGLGDAAAREHPLWFNIPKVPKFFGESFRYSVKYGNPQGVSGTFTTAQLRAKASKGLQFEAFRFAKYGVITLKGEAIAASEGNKGALIDLVTLETDSIINEMVDSLAFDLYRDGTGKRGKRLSAAANVITLTVADDARNFKVDMSIIASVNANGSAPRAGNCLITAVDEEAGTITVDNVANITGFANADFLFREGDPATCMEGLQVCTPLAAPTAGDSFRGKDRSVDPNRLAGSRVNDTSTNIEENAGLVGVKIGQRGKRAKQCYLNPINFWQVARRLNAKVIYQGGGGNADYGFETMSIVTPSGTLRAYSDPDCPTVEGRIFNPADHYIRHLRDCPHIVMDDGKPSLRQTSDDGIEARGRTWLNYIQTMTASHGVFAI